jgi:Na+-transporting methylmalonyl-CoA/oxaloacetate decarboxylase gamma subunit
MTNDPKHVNTNGHGDFERRDIGIGGVLYFLIILAAACLFTAFVVNALFKFLEKQNEAEQKPISPLVTNVPKDTRHLPTTYQQYLKQNFPAPQLEINERDQLDQIRLEEEDTLATYGWVDQSAGKVRIPIDRAMDLIAQRGLPVRQQNGNEQLAESKKK